MSLRQQGCALILIKCFVNAAHFTSVILKGVFLFTVVKAADCSRDEVGKRAFVLICVHGAVKKRVQCYVVKLNF